MERMGSEEWDDEEEANSEDEQVWEDDDDNDDDEEEEEETDEDEEWEWEEAEEAIGIITHGEGLFRQAVGAIVTGIGVLGYLSRLLHYPRVVSLCLAGSIFFNTGRKRQCGMSLRSLWNVDGHGYVNIPEEYKEFAQQKKQEFIRDGILITLASLFIALLVPYLEMRLSTGLTAQILTSFIWVYAVAFTQVLVVPAPKPSCTA